jgi:protein-S-isoprenylcysteine O-methyltransferase Ste14
VTIWVWAAVLILRKVPRRELITTGPFALMKHPIYTSVALLVIPAIGFLLNTWIGLAIGLAMYIGSRKYAPAEEVELSVTFGARWETYSSRVRLPWL